MKVKEKITDRYAELCKELGNLYAHKQRFEAKISELLDEINRLDLVTPLVGELDIVDESPSEVDSNVE